MLAMTQVVACHQPNFLPWLGFFAKMAFCDVFFLLNDVQFTQGHGKHNWTTRVRVLAANGPLWLSVPVRRAGEGRQLVSELRTDPQDSRWLPKMLKTVEGAYAKTPHFGEVYPAIAGILLGHTGNLCDTNIALIEHVHAKLGLKSRLHKSSNRAAEGSGNQRLINLTRIEGGKTYLSGDGADDYQVEAEFRAAGLALQRMEFRHPRYVQRHSAEFVAGLSIFDALCNIGAAATRELLLASRGSAIT